MRLLPKIVLAVLAPVVLGAAGAIWMLQMRLQVQQQAAAEDAARLLQDRAADITAQIGARRDALQLLAATPALRPQADAAQRQAALAAWSGAGSFFEGLALETGPADGRLHLVAAAAGSALPRVELRVPLPATQGGGATPTHLVARWPLAALLPVLQERPHWLLLDESGRLLAEPSAPGGRPGTTALALAVAVQALPAGAGRVDRPGTRPQPSDLQLGEAGYKLLQVPVAASDWRLVYAQPAADYRAAARGPVQRVMALVLGVLALALFGAWWVRRALMRPLDALVEAHARVAAGDLAVRAPVTGRGEVAALAESFNRMAEALDQADRKFRLVFEAFPHPVSLSRLSDGRLLDVNPAFERLSGHPRARIIGRHAVELGLTQDPQAIAEHSQALVAQGGVDNLPVTITDAAGRRRNLLYSSRRLALGGEGVALIVAIDITPMKEAEDRLRRSEQSFTALFESAPLPLSYARRRDDFGISHWNQAWYRSFGYPPELAEGRNGRDLGLWADPEDRERYGAAMRRDGEVTGMLVRLRHHDGGDRWYELSGRVIKTADGPVLMTAFADVTRLREAVAAAQASEARLKTVFDASPVAMAVVEVGQDRGIVAANAAWYRQYLRTPSQVIGRNGLQLGLWADAAQRVALMARLQHEGDEVTGFQAELLRGDGSRLLARIAARRFRAGDDELMLLAQEDITEQVRAEQALSESRALLAHTFDLTPEPLAIVSGEDGRYLDVNRMWVQVIGVPREQVLGRSSLELGLWDDPGERARWRAELESTGRLVDRPINFRLPAGGRIACEVSAVQMVWQGQSVGLWLVRDVTERQKTEARLRELNETLEHRVVERTRELSDALEGLRQAQAGLVQAEKLASLGALVAGVAHELNTPIGNAVMVASTLADHQRGFEVAIAGGLRRTALEAYLATAREAVQVLERNLRRAAELVGSFKQLAVDRSSDQRRRFELAEVVQEVLLALSPTLRRSAVRLEADVPGGLPLDSYPGPLSQVLVNLINNALLHAFEPDSAGQVWLLAEPQGPDRLRLRVRDNGRGIPEAALGRIFDPFFTTRLGQGGSGLGLHIVYNLVTGVLGGRIEVLSQVGQGTEFVIDLPACAPPA